MKILLAIDDSECSAAAAKAVITQFVSAGTEVLVLHADDWPAGLPASMAFAEGSAAADSVLDLHDGRRRAAERLVATTAARLRDAGFSAITAIREGDPRHAICACAEDCLIFRRIDSPSVSGSGSSRRTRSMPLKI